MSAYKKFGTSDILMLLAVFLWAVNFSLVKVALRDFTPLGFNGIRLVFASLLLVGFLFFSRESLRVSRAYFWQLLILGIVGNTAYQLLFIRGIDMTSASNTAIIIAITPVFIAFLSSVLKHEKLNVAAWIGIVTCFLGFYFVMSEQPGSFSFGPTGVKGDLMILAGTVCWAVYTVLAKPLLSEMSALKLTTFTMVTGTIFFLPFAARDMVSLEYDRIGIGAWASLAFSGLFALAICYVIWYASVKRVGNSRTAIYDNLVPIVSVLFAFVILDERITILQGVGTLVILAGVYLTRSGYRFFEKGTFDSGLKNT